MDIPVVQEKAWCSSCWTFHDPDDLRESYTKEPAKVCPDCGSMIKEQHIPENTANSIL